MKLWKSKKNSNNNNNNNTSSNSTISCVPGKSSTLVKDNNDTKSDVATTSSTNVSGKLMICNPEIHHSYENNEITDGLTMAIQTKKRINHPFNPPREKKKNDSQPQKNCPSTVHMAYGASASMLLTFSRNRQLIKSVLH